MEFKVNNFITLKYENERTNIYVSGELFRQCKYLLLAGESEETIYNDGITSIDEVAENLDKTLEVIEDVKFKIPPEVEFWGHCSNIQAWVEMKYDTRFLHSNLSFPLLKKLVDIGEPVARVIFKEEIAKRLETGGISTVIYLFKEGYHRYLEPKKKNIDYNKPFDPDSFLESEEFKSVIYNPDSSFFENLIRYLGSQKRDEDLVDPISDVIYKLVIDSILEAKLVNLLRHENESVLIIIIEYKLFKQVDKSLIKELFLEPDSNLRRNIKKILDPNHQKEDFIRAIFFENFLKEFLKFIYLLYQCIGIGNPEAFVEILSEEEKSVLKDNMLKNLSPFYNNEDFVQFIIKLYKKLNLNKIKQIKLEKCGKKIKEYRLVFM